MPFGLRGAPGAFQTVLIYMVFPLIGRGVIAYVDDLLAHSPDVESHAKLFVRVLKTVKGNRRYPKISKCNFGSDAIEYLGYRASSEGITPRLETVKAIEVWPEKLQNDPGEALPRNYQLLSQCLWDLHLLIWPDHW